jgi:hypothetical protein
MKSTVITGTVVLVLAVVGTWICVRRVQAQTGAPAIYPVTPQILTLGMVGLAPGQTARLYALNLPGFSAAESVKPPSAPCNTTLSFLDDQGAPLGTATAVINPGAAIHLDLAHDSVVHDSTRLQIRGVVQSATPPQPIPIPQFPVAFGCFVAPTLEIFDSVTGITTVVLEAPKAAPVLLPLMGGATAPMP